MNKMNLREFAEVLVAMMNQQGTVCFLNNDNPAKQLAVAMSKGDACAYAPVAPLWDSYEKGADLNQMAAAVSMAMKESLDKGSEMAKMNADRYAQQPTPSFKKHEAKETSDRFKPCGVFSRTKPGTATGSKERVLPGYRRGETEGNEDAAGYYGMYTRCDD